MLETNVHFPTDFNLLWDACRKSIKLMSQLSTTYNISGWRKSKYLQNNLKSLFRTCGQVNKSGGKNKEKRLENAVNAYLDKAYQLESKLNESIKQLQSCSMKPADIFVVEELIYFQGWLIHHIDLLDRRVLKEEQIPHHDKIFSLFEPHTEWINKGKSNPSVELGHKLSITTEQNGLILDYGIMTPGPDHNDTIAIVDRLFASYGENAFESLSVDKGFSTQGDRELLELYIPNLIMPKRGRLNEADKQRESAKSFKKLRNKHSAVESDINCLEHHGLNRCPDKGLNGFTRYVGLGILSYNLHKIGRFLLGKKEVVRIRHLKKAA